MKLLQRSLKKLNKVLGMLGLAKRAGQLVSGTDAVLDGIRKNKAKAVYISADASDNTKKKFCDSCKYYGIEYCILSNKMTEVSSAIGKMGNIAAVYVSDNELNKAVRKAAKADGGCVYGSTDEE